MIKIKASEKMEGVFELTLKELEAIFTDKKPLTDKSKMAVSILGVYSRLKSQENARLGLQYRAIKDYAKDKEELRGYMQSTTPELKVIEYKKK